MVRHAPPDLWFDPYKNNSRLFGRDVRAKGTSARVPNTQSLSQSRQVAESLSRRSCPRSTTMPSARPVTANSFGINLIRSADNQ